MRFYLKFSIRLKNSCFCVSREEKSARECVVCGIKWFIYHLYEKKINPEKKSGTQKFSFFIEEHDFFWQKINEREEGSL